MNIKKLEFRNLHFKSSYSEIAVCFGLWLNYHFYPWNPDDGTWMDENNCAFTTQELFDEFSSRFIK